MCLDLVYRTKEALASAESEIKRNRKGQIIGYREFHESGKGLSPQWKGTGIITQRRWLHEKDFRSDGHRHRTYIQAKSGQFYRFGFHAHAQPLTFSFHNHSLYEVIMDGRISIGRQGKDIVVVGEKMFVKGFVGNQKGGPI